MSEPSASEESSDHFQIADPPFFEKTWLKSFTPKLQENPTPLRNTNTNTNTAAAIDFFTLPSIHSITHSHSLPTPTQMRRTMTFTFNFAASLHAFVQPFFGIVSHATLPTIWFLAVKIWTFL